MEKESLLIIANSALKMGFIPIPLIGKRPTYNGWPNINKKNSIKIIVDEINKNRCDNIGVICGESSGIVVVDIDIKDDGLTLWNSLCEKHTTPDTFTIQTGSGGYHYYFKYDENTKVLKNAVRAIQGKGIDIKTTAGQVVFWGSIHPDTKRRYECINGYGDTGCNLISMPQWLLDLLIPKPFSNDAKTSLIPKPFDNDAKTLLFNKLNKKYTDEYIEEICSKTSNTQILEKIVDQKEEDFIQSKSIPREMLEELIDLLSDKRSSNYDFWLKGIWAIRNTNDGFNDLAHTFSQKCPDKYDKVSVDKIWNYVKQHDKTVRFGTLMLWLKEDINIKNYEEFKSKWYEIMNKTPFRTLYELYIYKNDVGLSDYFVSQIKNKNICVCTNLESEIFYVWSEESLLWKRGKNKTLIKYVRNIIEPMILEVISGFEKDINNNAKKKSQLKDDDEKVAQYAALMQYIKKTLKKCESVLTRFTQITGLLAVCKLCAEGILDETFEKNINALEGYLPVRNGKVINLRTGEVRMRTKEDKFTFECPVTYNPTVPMIDIERYVSDISLGNDKETLQTILGWAITGDTTAQKIIILHNPEGGASKSTLMNLVSSILGDYYRNAERSVAFMKKGAIRNEGGHTEYLTQLEERRVVGFCESSSSSLVEEHYNETFLKMVSGGDQISGRGINEKSKVLRIWFAAFVIVNKLPMSSTDEAFWRRLVPILMKARFVSDPDPEDPFQRKNDPEFINRLKSEDNKSAFLNWLIIGAQKFYKNGFPNTLDIMEYQLKYKLQNDSLLQFIYTQCEIGKIHEDEAGKLWDAFVTWKKEYSGEDKREFRNQRHLCDEMTKLSLLTSLDMGDDYEQSLSTKESIKITKSQSKTNRRVTIKGLKLKTCQM